MTPGGRAGGTALVCWPCVSTTAVGTTMMMTSRKDMAPMMNDLAELKTHQCEAMQSNDMDMMTVEAQSGWLAGKMAAMHQNEVTGLCLIASVHDSASHSILSPMNSFPIQPGG